MKHKLIISIIIVLSFAKLNGQGFLQFLSKVNSSKDSLRQELVDDYMTEIKIFPIVEDTFAHFVFKCEGLKPHLAGDFTGWDPTIAPMENIVGTDVWFITKSFDRGARLDYQFVYNDSIWVLDPLNPNKNIGGFGYNSELRMPDYIIPKEIDYVKDNLHGTIIDTTWYSKELGNSRQIKVYLPPNYYSEKLSYPLVLVNDGSEYLSYAKMDNVLDNLISNGVIRPIIAVFVPPIDRTKEYVTDYKENYTDFIINDVIDWVDKKFRTQKDPSNRMVMGSSYGGNISLWISKEHPNTFGLVGVFSPFIEDDILNYFADLSDTNLDIFILHGKYDHIDAIHESAHNLRSILDKKSIKYIYREYPDSHSYGFWRGHIDELLTSYFTL